MMIQRLDAVVEILRLVFLGAAVLLGVVCLADWMVRTRRISPFSRVARFTRGTIDPLLAPIERRVVRAGGLPSSAPFWALGAAIVGGIVAFSLLGFIRSQILISGVMMQGGARGIAALLVSWMFQILRIALLVRVISSWIRLSPFSPWIRWSYALTEPMLRPLRRIIPTIGMIDITPILAYFVLGMLERVVAGAIWP